MWLEEMLKNFKRILLMVSHSQDFMNGVCTNIIHMSQKQLNYYTGLAPTYILRPHDPHEACRQPLP